MTEMTIERVVPLILGAGKFLVQTEKPTKLVPMRSEERFRWVRQSIMPKKKQPKILIYYHHGLGDIIQLTPHLRFFYQQGCKVDLMCTNDVVQSHLLDACPYINQLIVVENPWRSGLKNYVKTIQKNIEGMDQLLGYDKRLIVDHLGTFYNVPKLDYTSYQLGILRDLQDKRGEVFIPEMIEEEVQEYCDKHFPKGFIFNHTAIELNPHNSWDSSAWIKDNLPDLPIVNTGAGGSHFKIHEDINFTFVLIKRANHVVVSDSVMLWACFAMNKPIDIAYYGRPDLRSLPLDKHLVQRLVWNAEILQGAEKDRIFDSRKIMKIN